MFTHLGDSFDYVFTLNPCKVLNVGIVVCQRKSFLSIWILFEKNWPKALPAPIFTWKVRMKLGVTNGNSKILIQNVNGIILNFKP